MAVLLAILSGCGTASNDGGGSSVGARDSGGGGFGATGSGATSGSGASSGSGVGATSIGGTLVLETGGASSAGGTPAGNGEAEVCDGVDNDANGIIDDVDAGHDGVCDCLSIATIGHIGPWSNGGNLFATWLSQRSPMGVVELADQELTAELLNKIQIVVVLHAGTSEVSNAGRTTPAHHEFSDAEAAAFDAWVRAGGGAMTTIGYTFDEAREVLNVNKLLGKVGLGYSTTKLGLSGMVQAWETHPLSEGIMRINTADGVEPDGTGGMIIARSGERVALQAAQVDGGRVAIWGDEWITYDSEWVDTQDQQVEHFWLNLLKWLSPPKECQVPIPPRVK